MIADLWQDLRFGARMSTKQPGFSLIVILTLALGIGATTAIFTVFDALLLRPLPYPEAERLAVVCPYGDQEARRDDGLRRQGLRVGAGIPLIAQDYSS